MLFGSTDLPAADVAVVCGVSSRNLCVIDVDDPQRFEQMHKVMVRQGLRTWVRASRRGGHFWFLIEEGEAANADWNGYQILGHDRYAVAPPSVYGDTGEVVQWAEQHGDEPLTVSVEQLAPLGVTLRAPKRARGDKGQLPPVADDVLVGGNVDRYDGDNSRAEFAACLSLLGIGLSKDEVMTVFRRFHPPHFRRVGEEAFRRYVLDKAASRHDPNAMEKRNGRATRDALDYLARLETTPFPGRTGNADKAVLSALAWRMCVANSYAFRASLREITEQAGVALDTARKAMDRLRERGYVWRVNKTEATGASVWELNLRQFPLLESAVQGPVEAGDAGHDAWQIGALGKSGLWTYQYLTRHPDGLLQAEVARGTGKHPTTVKKSLRSLSGEGLAFSEYEEGRGWVWHAAEVQDWQLNRVAYYHRTAGRRDARSARFREDRARHASRQILHQMREVSERTARGSLTSP